MRAATKETSGKVPLRSAKTESAAVSVDVLSSNPEQLGTLAHETNVPPIYLPSGRRTLFVQSGRDATAATAEGTTADCDAPSGDSAPIDSAPLFARYGRRRGQ